MAKQKKKKLTPNQQEYNKQVNRIKNAVKRAEKRGYTFDTNVIPEKPKRITKKVIQELKRITPNVIYSMAEYVDTATGEILNGFKARQLERKESARKATETRKRNKEAERKFWSGESDEKKDNYLPDGGDIIFHNVYNDFISKIPDRSAYDELITSLNEQTPSVTPFGKKRQYQAYEYSEKGRTTLLSITLHTLSKIGQSNLGWRLEQNKDKVHELVTYVLYGSDGSKIATATSELASIILGRKLEMTDLRDIGKQEEENEDGWVIDEN